MIYTFFSYYLNVGEKSIHKTNIKIGANTLRLFILKRALKLSLLSTNSYNILKKLKEKEMEKILSTMFESFNIEEIKNIIPKVYAIISPLVSWL